MKIIVLEPNSCEHPTSYPDLKAFMTMLKSLEPGDVVFCAHTQDTHLANSVAKVQNIETGEIGFAPLCNALCQVQGKEIEIADNRFFR